MTDFEFNEGLNSEGEGSSDSEKEEEQRDEDMADKYLDWMAQGPLTLPGNLHRMPRHFENLLSKFDPNNKTKVQDHIDNLYMHLLMLEAQYNDVACIIFPFTLEGRVATCYHSMRINSIHGWWEFKIILLEKFVDLKSPAMLLKEPINIKMGEKEKVKDFNQSFNRILNKFPPYM